jgi:hypothetical protein
MVHVSGKCFWRFTSTYFGKSWSLLKGWAYSPAFSMHHKSESFGKSL